MWVSGVDCVDWLVAYVVTDQLARVSLLPVRHGILYITTSHLQTTHWGQIPYVRRNSPSNMATTPHRKQRDPSSLISHHVSNKSVHAIHTRNSHCQKIMKISILITLSRYIKFTYIYSGSFPYILLFIYIFFSSLKSSNYPTCPTY